MRKHFLFALMVLMMIGINVNIADAARPPQNGNQNKDCQKVIGDAGSTAGWTRYVQAYMLKDICLGGDGPKGCFVIINYSNETWSDFHVACWVPYACPKPGAMTYPAIVE